MWPHGRDPAPQGPACSAHSQPTVPSWSQGRHGGGWGTWGSNGDSEAEFECVNSHVRTHPFSFAKTGSHCVRDKSFHGSLTAGALGAGSHVPARPPPLPVWVTVSGHGRGAGLQSDRRPRLPGWEPACGGVWTSLRCPGDQPAASRVSNGLPECRAGCARRDFSFGDLRICRAGPTCIRQAWRTTARTEQTQISGSPGQNPVFLKQRTRQRPRPTLTAPRGTCPRGNGQTERGSDKASWSRGLRETTGPAIGSAPPGSSRPVPERGGPTAQPGWLRTCTARSRGPGLGEKLQRDPRDRSPRQQKEGLAGF